MKTRSRIAALSAAAATTLAGLAALITSPAQAAPAADLMISAYVEGSGNNKAVELYNPTTATLTLARYILDLHANGSTTATTSLTLSGVLGPGEHYLITNSQATIFGYQSDLTHGVTSFNGNDALVLRRAATVLDTMGQVGVSEDWPNMAGRTLVKNACEVDTDPSDAYETAYFDASPRDTVSTLGTFECDPLVDLGGGGPTPDPSVSPILPGELLIGDVQGTTETGEYRDRVVILDGYVTATFQGTEPGKEQFDGYYIQDEGDGDPATSDAIFVYAPGGEARTVGEEVRITGAVTEAFNQTQLDPDSVEVLSTGNDVIAATELTVPVGDFERYEGMYVTFPQDLTILEFFNYDRFGEIVYGLDRQWTPTAVAEPGAAALAIAAQNAANRVIADDGFNSQNVSPAIHPNGDPFARDNYFRGGDKVANLTGIMSYRNDTYKVQPTQGADYTAVNERPAVPEVGGNFTVASFNVLNYFTTLNMRGATTDLELERQQAKIVAALAEIDADVFGLMEIQNNAPTAVAHLVDGLNAEVGAGTYAYIDTGVVGTDEIMQAIIYKTATAEPVGDFAVLDFNDGKNRPSLLQTFRHVETGELVSLDVNHLKSKGSDCEPSDPDLGDGAGNCNLTRLAAAEAIVEWLETDPTGQGSTRTIVMGDLNSYDHEEPIDAFVEAGYTDLEKQFNGDEAYSYVFDGQLGYLDYGLANEGAAADVVGTATWHINADESDLFDYTMQYKDDNEDALWAADPYRSSDHDPVIIGLQLDEVVEPTEEPSEEPTEEPTDEPTDELGDLYETPGFHESGGRQWMTVCEPYSVTTRCWTYIWGTTIGVWNGAYYQHNGWTFNNLTYLGSPRQAWAGNPLGHTGSWTADDGRQWRTECDTPAVGGNGCRSWVTATLIERSGNSYRSVTKEVFNNIVRFS